MTIKEFVNIYDYQKKVCEVFPTKESEMLMEILNYINQPGCEEKIAYIDYHDIIEVAGMKNWKEIIEKRMEGK